MCDFADLPLEFQKALPEAVWRALSSWFEVVITDKSGKVVYSNDLFLEFCGVAPGDQIPSQVGGFTDNSADAIEWSQLMSMQKHFTDPLSDEFKMIGPDGRIRWIRAVVAPLKSQLEIIGCVSIGRDITSEKELNYLLHESIREHEYSLNQLNNQVQLMSALIDLHRLFNEDCRTSKDYPRILEIILNIEFLGFRQAAFCVMEQDALMAVADVGFSPSLSNEHLQSIKQMTGRTIRWVPREESSFLPGPCYSVPLRANKQTVGLIVLGGPTKEHPDVKRALESIATTLGQLLYQQALEDKIEEDHIHLFAQSKMAVLGQMAAGIAHEINNPIAVIQGRTFNLMQKLQDRPQGTEVCLGELQKILSSTERVTAIVKGIRTIARKDERDPLEQVLLSNIINECLMVTREKFLKHQTRVEVGVSGQEFPVLGRPAQYAQVFLNLLSNSLDAICALTEKWIRVDLHFENDWARIRVTDAGPGIVEDIASKMMQPFFTTKPPGEGTGLGLSITKSIIEAINGRFSYNGSHAYTQFIIEVPAATNGASVKAT